MLLFQVPPPTRYDLRFNLAGFPVRVHPLFWLIAVLLGYSSGDPLQILIWVVVVFVSILIHEMGQRWYSAAMVCHPRCPALHERLTSRITQWGASGKRRVGTNQNILSSHARRRFPAPERRSPTEEDHHNTRLLGFIPVPFLISRSAGTF
jgi:hypothetical protein